MRYIKAWKRGKSQQLEIALDNKRNILVKMWAYLLLALVPFAAADRGCKNCIDKVEFDPDITRNVSELISSKGYPVEDHVTQTKDGFILSMQRIPNGRKAPGNYKGKKTVVFLQHGLLSASSDFVLNFPEESLGFILADSGYDVWMGNTRGNTYSRKHTRLNPNTDEFWDYRLGYEKKGGKPNGLFKFLAKILGIRDFLPNDKIMKWLSEYLCEWYEKIICENVMFLFFGRDYQELNATRIGVYGGHTPAGSSVKSIVHFAQMIEADFAKFDYGKKGNIARYGQATPPVYDISKITTPVALLSGLNDNLADPKDVEIVAKKLKTLVSNYVVPLDAFNHIDFILAIDGKKLVHNEVERLLLKYVSREF
ncbi:hypothetical protein NPIL_66411 [Nephila pilipes]|uniref:Lipase n=1 Tax=Nephila pilipes TaxID=299642 RepID=A0A8X6U6D0_NEPPI|nr:hypothetical protein NPIL_66411 [Nephila pilipes]